MENTSHSIEREMQQLAARAAKAASTSGALSTQRKNLVLASVADLLDNNRQKIRSENAKDLENGKAKGLTAAMLERLELTDGIIDGMIAGLHEVHLLADPVGSIEGLAVRPNGLQVGRMRVPLGVVAMIYESRPNVTVDAAALCLKTGNSVILRGGSEALYSNILLASLLQEALELNNVDSNMVQVVQTTDRQAVHFLLQQEGLIDLVIPRGGEGLIRYVTENSRIPVLKHFKGVCHIYVDNAADVDKAIPIVLNAKTHRPGVCNALEGILVHREIADHFIPEAVRQLTAAGVDVRGCSEVTRLSPEATLASESDWGTEFLDLIVVMKVVDSMEESQAYIRKYGSNHTEVILTESYLSARKFVAEVDASAVMVNASTRFNDGGQLGLGTEIGISTSKLHAYGPMGLEELTTRKFVVFGEGQIRE